MPEKRISDSAALKSEITTLEITREEYQNLKSQIVISSWGGRRKLPMVFTEQGVAMLSSVLNSEKAIEVNIRIVRIFTRMREVLLSHKDILLKLEQIEKQVTQHNSEIEHIFDVLKQLVQQSNEPREKIGYKIKGLK